MYKFRFEIMSQPDVSLDMVMDFCTQHQMDFAEDGSFLLSVATWLVNDYQRYDWASQVLLYTTEIFKNEQVSASQ